MSYLKKVSRKAGRVKKLGSKLFDKLKIGTKKGAGYLSSAGQALSGLGAVTAQPQIIGAGGSMYGLGQAIRKTIEKN